MKKTTKSKAPKTAYNHEFRDTEVKLPLAGNKSTAEVSKKSFLTQCLVSR